MFRTAEKRPAGSFHIFNASAEHFKVPSTLGEKYRRNLGKKRFFLKSGTHDLETPMCIFYMHVRITTRIDIYSYCVLQCGIFKSVLIHNMHIYILYIYRYFTISCSGPFSLATSNMDCHHGDLKELQTRNPLVLPYLQGPTPHYPPAHWQAFCPER